MSIGPKIKLLRNKSNLTQKDLAEKLHVTYQAVSRWENDEAEPSIDTIKELCKIFNCSINELLDLDDNKVKEEEKVEVNKSPVNEVKPVLAVCEDCNSPIYDSKGIHRVNINSNDGKNVVQKKILCRKCNEKLKQFLKYKEEKKKRLFLEELVKKRNKSFIFSSLFLALMVVIALFLAAEKYYIAALVFVILGAFGFLMIGTIILDNTPYIEALGSIACNGFTRFPGIIFSFSLDGFLFLIGMKILFQIIAIGSSWFFTILALAICAPLSIIFYPIALYRNFKKIA